MTTPNPISQDKNLAELQPVLNFLCIQLSELTGYNIYFETSDIDPNLYRAVRTDGTFSTIIVSVRTDNQLQHHLEGMIAGIKFVNNN